MSRRVQATDAAPKAACLSGRGVACDHGVQGVPRCKYQICRRAMARSSSRSVAGRWRSNSPPRAISKGGSACSPASSRAPVRRAVPA
eukprot:2607017-Alexandrium_andersonii.AAC.1